METNQADYFTYQNKIKALKHEMELVVTQMNTVSASIKNVYMELEELDKCQPLVSPSDNSQKPYEEHANPDSQTPLEKIGDGG
ncbi:MAG: hypothetical protein ABL933_02210 [Methyloglobulus sp.]|nr:hypothetical protein [Methyloglobulus sp.]